MESFTSYDHMDYTKISNIDQIQVQQDRDYSRMYGEICNMRLTCLGYYPRRRISKPEFATL
jgi:hypothetical protein